MCCHMRRRVNLKYEQNSVMQIDLTVRRAFNSIPKTAIWSLCVNSKNLSLTFSPPCLSVSSHSLSLFHTLSTKQYSDINCCWPPTWKCEILPFAKYEPCRIIRTVGNSCNFMITMARDGIWRYIIAIFVFGFVLRSIPRYFSKNI